MTRQLRKFMATTLLYQLCRAGELNYNEILFQNIAKVSEAMLLFLRGPNTWNTRMLERRLSMCVTLALHLLRFVQWRRNKKNSLLKNISFGIHFRKLEKHKTDSKKAVVHVFPILVRLKWREFSIGIPMRFCFVYTHFCERDSLLFLEAQCFPNSSLMDFQFFLCHKLTFWTFQSCGLPLLLCSRRYILICV